MRNMKLPSKIKIYFLALFLSMAPLVLNAQTNFDQTDPDGGDVSDSPVDGGVALLLIAGLGLGAIKIYRVKMQAKTNTAV